MESLNQRLPPMMASAGFTEIEQGRRYRVLSYVRGRANKPEGGPTDGPLDPQVTT
jgi:hypothetical protein